MRVLTGGSDELTADESRKLDIIHDRLQTADYGDERVHWVIDELVTAVSGIHRTSKPRLNADASLNYIRPSSRSEVGAAAPLGSEDDLGIPLLWPAGVLSAIPHVKPVKFGGRRQIHPDALVCPHCDRRVPLVAVRRPLKPRGVAAPYGRLVCGSRPTISEIDGDLPACR
jgi:hypothetical protein